jgi:hypothetical protein
MEPPVVLSCRKREQNDKDKGPLPTTDRAVNRA